jgi:transposase InsO family protein
LIASGKIDAIRDETDRRRPFLILLSSLPESAQKKYREEQAGALVACSTAPSQIIPLALPAPAANAKPDPRYRELWAWYEKLGTESKQQAESALAAVVDFHDTHAAGVSIGMTTAAVTEKHGISKATLWRYRNDVAGHPRGYWLPLLAPRYCGNGKDAEFTEEAWEWILSRYLTQTQIKISVLVRLARQEGTGKGWKIPCTKTVARRLQRESAPLVILGRHGPKALEASFPTVEKDWACVPLHEMWESDGCRLNLFARWPDGSIGRPFIVTWRECRSRLVLSCKGYLNPCGELVMASFRDAIENCGYKPGRASLDNGREYANKAFTGGQPTRYRFKIKHGDPVGVVTQMGVNVEWAKPGRGREKIIESWHDMLHENVDQLPEFEGAYCGKDALSKPEDFDPKKAVPIELVNAALGRFLSWYNTQHKHRGDGMNRRTPQAVYEELLPSVNKAEHTPDPAHLRLLLMAVKTLKPDKGEATFRLKLDGYGERRYWSKEFSALPEAARLKKYHVWYHPENPDLPIAIYDGDTWLCDCNPIGRIPAVGAGEAAGAHVEAKNALMKPIKNELNTIKAAGKLIDDRPKSPPPQPTESVSLSDERRAELQARRERIRQQNLPAWARRKSA